MNEKSKNLQTRILQSNSFPDLNINFANNNWLISVYDKGLDFNFKVNSLTNQPYCISKKVLKNILFPQPAKIKKVCNNYDSLMLANRNLAVTANKMVSRLIF